MQQDLLAGRWCVGLMTGTAMDGMIDVAAIRTDGERVLAFGPAALMPYPAPVLRLVSAAQQAAPQWNFDGPEPALFAEAERALSEAQADAVRQFLAAERMPDHEVAVIGFHGQTVLHRAPAAGRTGATRQLGDGALMAARLGIDVVFDFRTADVLAGGQGAPLAPCYHMALMRSRTERDVRAVLNLGGVGNLSWWDGADDLVAFDTGPANGPLNDWVARYGLGSMDRDGALAASGRVDERRLAALLEHPFFRQPFPKSLDRFDFPAAMADGLSPADGAATLTAFAAACVGRGLDLLPERPARVAVCGGGRRNPVLMRELAHRAGVAAMPAEAFGWRGDAVEAECFAFLAARVLRNLPISFPRTTGVRTPMTGGRVARAPER